MKTATEYATELKTAYWDYMRSPGMNDSKTTIDGIEVRLTPQGVKICKGGYPLANYGSQEWDVMGAELQYQVVVQC